jgi:hypothetical protein
MRVKVKFTNDRNQVKKEIIDRLNRLDVELKIEHELNKLIARDSSWKYKILK